MCLWVCMNLKLNRWKNMNQILIITLCLCLNVPTITLLDHQKAAWWSEVHAFLPVRPVLMSSLMSEVTSLERRSDVIAYSESACSKERREGPEPNTAGTKRQLPVWPLTCPTLTCVWPPLKHWDDAIVPICVPGYTDVRYVLFSIRTLCLFNTHTWAKKPFVVFQCHIQ